MKEAVSIAFENKNDIFVDSTFNKKEYILNYNAIMRNYYLQNKHFINNICESYNSGLLKLTYYKKLFFGLIYI